MNLSVVVLNTSSSYCYSSSVENFLPKVFYISEFLLFFVRLFLIAELAFDCEIFLLGKFCCLFIVAYAFFALIIFDIFPTYPKLFPTIPILSSITFYELSVFYFSRPNPNKTLEFDEKSLLAYCLF